MLLTDIELDEALLARYRHRLHILKTQRPELSFFDPGAGGRNINFEQLFYLASSWWWCVDFDLNGKVHCGILPVCRSAFDEVLSLSSHFCSFRAANKTLLTLWCDQALSVHT